MKLSYFLVSHLVVSISGHGFGHVAQTAPILNALHRLLPDLRITVRSAVPLTHLRSRIQAPFTHLKSEGDIGMVMSSALDVRGEDSRVAYQRFHADWDMRVDNEAALLRELQADYVFSNVGYLALAGAQRAGIGNAALCSLNWFDIYSHYCGSDRIAAQIKTCYANADAFLRATPGMEMTSLPNLIPVAPIVDLGENRRDELNRKLKLSHEQKLVLVSMGGIDTRLPVEQWPRLAGVKYLVQQSWQVEHTNAIVLESLGMSFNDLLSSSDVLLCKPGYGSFVEATYSGVPVLYVSRADWPESTALVDWLKTHGACREVSRENLERGNLAQDLKVLFEQQCKPGSIPAGAVQVANWLAEKLSA
jgi:hypothetical protein